jgi:hypothetical protein
MSAESITYGALSALAGGKVFPDIAPVDDPDTGLPVVAPWITYQSVGGQAFNTVDSATPGLRNSRMQVTVWAKTRAQAASIMEQAFQALVNPAVKAVPIGAPVSTFEPDTLLYGSSLDFSITYLG